MLVKKNQPKNQSKLSKDKKEFPIVLIVLKTKSKLLKDEVSLILMKEVKMDVVRA